MQEPPLPLQEPVLNPGEAPEIVTVSPARKPCGVAVVAEMVVEFTEAVAVMVGQLVQVSEPPAAVVVVKVVVVGTVAIVTVPHFVLPV
jgi:hypothetical protein